MSDKPFTLEPTPSGEEKPFFTDGDAITNAKCKGCGKLILWARNYETGKDVPLDPSAPVYLVTYSGRTAAELTGRAMVSHFATCPKANDFSGSRRS